MVSIIQTPKQKVTWRIRRKWRRAERLRHLLKQIKKRQIAEIKYAAVSRRN